MASPLGRLELYRPSGPIPYKGYNWAFLLRCHERGWLYRGHRPMPWCPRCGTSISQHELLDAYAELPHESLTAALPLRDRPDRRLLVSMGFGAMRS